MARAAVLGSLVWLGLHAVLAYDGAIRLHPLPSTIVVLACTVAVRADLRRNSAHVFYANLGVSPAQGVAVGFGLAAILELLLQVLVRLSGVLV